MDVNELYECMQSAYCKKHSTDTSLLHVQNDMLCAVDDRCAVVLVLLELCAAFDTVDHALLISRLSTRCGKALAWFESYLSDWIQCIGIHGVKSSSQDHKYGVPQDAVLGPKFFSIYSLPLGDIIRKHKLEFKLYTPYKTLNEHPLLKIVSGHVMFLLWCKYLAFGRKVSCFCCIYPFKFYI